MPAGRQDLAAWHEEFAGGSFLPSALYAARFGARSMELILSLGSAAAHPGSAVAGGQLQVPVAGCRSRWPARKAEGCRVVGRGRSSTGNGG